MAVKRKTQRRNQYRKNRKQTRSNRVMDVRSKSAIQGFEKLLGKGPLTLVLIYADWCGACHKFRDEVWSPLTNLKNATMNRAAIREDMVNQTSLANVERQFYPTLLLVGNDKKPATFMDENGQSTNAMPRRSTLEEDKESLTALVNSPTPLIPVTKIPTPIEELEELEEPAETLERPAYSIEPIESVKRMTPSNTLSMNLEEADMEPSKSPFTAKSPAPSLIKTFMNSSPPDVGADLVASQTRERPVLMKGGKLLRAIRNKTQSLKSLLKLRKTYRK